MKYSFEISPHSYALELVDDCTVTADTLLNAALQYLSPDDVREMLDANELSPRHLNDDADDADESMDGDHETALESVYGSNEDWREYDSPDDREEF